MSTTSTTFNDYKKCNTENRTSRANPIKKANHAKSLRARENIDKYTPLKIRSNERVLDELSTFIAEFSYLTDEHDLKPETPNNPIRSHNAFLQQSSENNESFLIKKLNYNRRRKSVEWIDQRRPYPDQRTNGQFYSETLVETSESVYRSRKPTDFDYVLDQLKKRPQYKKIRIQSDNENRHWRQRPTSKHHKPIHDNKKLMRFRVESNERIRKPSYHTIRKKQSKPRVRYWPFRYDKKRTQFRIGKHPLVRKENCIPFERKVEISSDSPTVITLYPKNTKRKLSHAKVDELDFLDNPDLPCKCVKCMRKYELLQQISNIEPNTVYYKPINENHFIPVDEEDIGFHPKTLTKQPEKCACKNRRSGRTVLHPKNSIQMENNVFCPNAFECMPAYKKAFCGNTINQRCKTQFYNTFRECQKNSVHYSMPIPTSQSYLPSTFVKDCCRTYSFNEPYSNLKCHNLKPCPYPCEDEHNISNWNLNEIGSCDEQNGDTFYKSVYFRFDCVGHLIDPAVTQYFHSILDNKTY